MNFTRAYAFLLQGYAITRPGMAFSLKIDNGRLVKEAAFVPTCPFEELSKDTIEMFAETDWLPWSAQKNIKEPPKIVIKFKRIQEKGWNTPVAPFHVHEDDRGFDLTCVWKEKVRSHVWRYHSGLAFSFPDGIDAELRSRSSIYNTGLILSNGVGTIDHGYTGEVQAVFYEMFVDDTQQNHYNLGDRFAQLIIPGVDPRDVAFEEVEELPKTARGAGGYGSTGK